MHIITFIKEFFMSVIPLIMSICYSIYQWLYGFVGEYWTDILLIFGILIVGRLVYITFFEKGYPYYGQSLGGGG